MDARFRDAERKFLSGPSKETLSKYLREIERAGLANDYDRIVSSLIMVSPLTGENWPWYTDPDYIYDQRSPYNENKHIQILNLMARVRPLSLVAEIVATWSDPRDFSKTMSLVRGQLIQENIGEILTDEEMEHFYSYYEGAEDALRLALRRGLVNYPEYIALDFFEPWKMGGWGYPTDRNSIITIIESSDPIIAERYMVYLDSEPVADITSEGHWDVAAGYWQGEYGRRSSTFLPYRKYCDMHKQDLILCGPCPVCGAEEHNCWCEQCDICGLYDIFTTKNVNEYMRCQCD